MARVIKALEGRRDWTGDHRGQWEPWEEFELYVAIVGRLGRAYAGDRGNPSVAPNITLSCSVNQGRHKRLLQKPMGMGVLD